MHAQWAPSFNQKAKNIYSNTNKKNKKNFTGVKILH